MGISYHKATGKYEAYVLNGGKKLHLGVYKLESEARGAVCGAKKVLAKCQ